MLELRNCPVENSSSPPQLIYGRCFRSLLPIYQEKLKMKTINDNNIQDEKVQKQWKQAFYYDQHVKCQKQVKEAQDVYVSKQKIQGGCSQKKVQNLVVTSSRHKIARYMREIETDCDLSNLKKHLLSYLTMKTTMSMIRIKLIMRR